MEGASTPEKEEDEDADEDVTDDPAVFSLLCIVLHSSHWPPALADFPQEQRCSRPPALA